MVHNLFFVIMSCIESVKTMTKQTTNHSFFSRIISDRTGATRTTLHDYLEDEFLQKDGTAVIDINLNDVDVFDPISYGHQLDLNPDIIEYIDKKVNLIPIVYPIVLRFHASNLTDETKTQIEHCLREHYYVELQDKAWDKRNNKMQILYLTVLGLVFISLYIYSVFVLEEGLFVEFLSVVGSFALWEAADRFLLERQSIKFQMNESAQCYESKIMFMDE